MSLPGHPLPAAAGWVERELRRLAEGNSASRAELLSLAARLHEAGTVETRQTRRVSPAQKLLEKQRDMIRDLIASLRRAEEAIVVKKEQVKLAKAKNTELFNRIVALRRYAQANGLETRPEIVNQYLPKGVTDAVE